MATEGPVIYVNAEDDERELHFRLEAIRAHLGVRFVDLANLHLVCRWRARNALLGDARSRRHHQADAAV